MAPPRKVPAGSVTRSILFRADQIAALELDAEWAGADVSDVVRAAVDLLFPTDAAARRARARAALELRRREWKDQPHLVQAVWDGWRGLEPRLPLDAADRDVARRVRETVGMVRRLYPAKAGAGEAAARKMWSALGEDWAGQVPDEAAALLAVLSSLAARCFVSFKMADDRPYHLAVAEAVRPREGRAAETQYEGLGDRVEGLVRGGVLTFFHPLKLGLPYPSAVMYRIDWGKLGL